MALKLLALSALAVASATEETKVELGCMCYYGNAMHNCNYSPFPNDNRCVCGTAGSDWKTPEQCHAPPAPSPNPQPNPSSQCTQTAAGQRSVSLPGCQGTGCYPHINPTCAFCVYDMYACTAAYGAAACQETYDARKAQGVYGCPSSTKSEDVMVATPEVAKSDLGCMCYYGGAMHNCNHSPFPNDNRCVCGTAQSDWKTPAQCNAPPAPNPSPPNPACACPCRGKCCNTSPFPNDDRCVCGTAASDWIPRSQCDTKEEEQVLVATPEVAKAEGGCMCYYGNAMHNCNYSPFPNDNRCVCGTAASDWKTPEQCHAPPAPSPNRPNPQPNPSTQCTQTAAGQSSVSLPGCQGTGCYPHNNPTCGFCVYDMYACTAAYGAAACQETYDARKAQGVYGCQPPNTIV